MHTVVHSLHIGSAVVRFWFTALVWVFELRILPGCGLTVQIRLVLYLSLRAATVK